jgi:hypothetical protein
MSNEAIISKRFAEAAAFLETFPVDREDLQSSATSAALSLAHKWNIGGQAGTVLLLAHFGHKTNTTLNLDQAVKAVQEGLADTASARRLFYRMETIAEAVMATGDLLRILGATGVDLDQANVKRVGSLLNVIGNFGLRSLDPNDAWVA